MARLPYYSDPVFIQKAMQRLPSGQSFASPFSATSRNVMAALGQKRQQTFGNQLAQDAASAARRQSMFNYGQDWARYGGQLNREAQKVQANAQMEYQRQVDAAQRRAAKKSRRRGILGSAVGALGAIGGAALGSMVAPGVGTMVGSQIGGGLGGGIGRTF